MSYRYFAYGSILDAEHFAEWSAEHGYAGRVMQDGVAAVLDDWELQLTVPSRYWMGAVGTIEPHPGAAVYGVLYTLPDDWADMVRHKEGVASGLYREQEVEVRLWAGGDEESTMQLLTASAFRAANPGGGRAQHAAAAASQRWVDIVLRGAKAHGLPDLWAAEIKRKARRP